MGTQTQNTVDFSFETMVSRRNWYIFKVLDVSFLTTMNYILVKLSVKNEGEIKTFSVERKLREFAISKPTVK